MRQTPKQFLIEQIDKEAEGISFDVLIPPDPSLGDYSTNLAFVLAKKEGKQPFNVAQALKKELENDEMNDICAIQVAPNGFLNFFLKPEFLQGKLVEINNDENYGQSEEGKGKKVIVEYSSPNIAKPMHIGHLRSTIIGDALANVYEKLGYDVVRWNYIGDWGTQFGKLIAAFKKPGWLDEQAFQENPIQEMQRLYVKFHDELKNNPELEKEGQEEFRKLEEGDADNRKIWEMLRAKSITEFDKIYARIGIGADKLMSRSESDYEPKLKLITEELKQKGLVKESEGALIIELDSLPPALLQKSDGATLYITRDIASLEDRIENYHPEKILYVVANQQALHFEQLFAVAKKLGWTDTELIHVKFGMVLGEDGKKLATREGRVVSLQEVMNKITALAFDTVKQKNSDLTDDQAKEIARVVGIGALKYNDLKQHPYSDITFDWKAMLDLSGDSGPYIQYTYARLANILNKAGKYDNGDVGMLIEPSVRSLMRQILDFPDIIMDCTKFCTLNGLALYLYELASFANKFYEQIHILEDENIQRRNARLVLINSVAKILKEGLSLLGVETLERI